MEYIYKVLIYRIKYRNEIDYNNEYLIYTTVVHLNIGGKRI